LKWSFTFIYIGVPLRPMLGKVTRDLSQVFKNLEGRSFNCEYKYDGQRAQIHMDDNKKVTIFSRNLEVTFLNYWKYSL